MSSLPPDIPALDALVRNHWSIESIHWALTAIYFKTGQNAIVKSCQKP